MQGPESNSSDIIKDMSPQTNIHAPSFEDDEFEIPSVNILRFFNNWLAGPRKDNWFLNYEPVLHQIDDDHKICVILVFLPEGASFEY